jgi:hypothetical protein
MMQMASIYERDGKWYVRPKGYTVTGLWIGTSPLIELDARDTRDRKGEAVLGALSASQHGIPTPSDGNTVAVPLLEAAKVRSWSEFMKKARSVHVEREGERLKVMPYRKRDRTGAQEGIPDEAVELPITASAKEVGAAVEEALSRCK